MRVSLSVFCVLAVLTLSSCALPGQERTVTYEVSGQETAEVAYVNSDADLVKGQVVALPWSMTVKSRAGRYVSVLTNGVGEGALVCTLKVDGEQVVTQRSKEVPVVRCETTLR